MGKERKDARTQRRKEGLFYLFASFVLILHLGWSASSPGWQAYGLIWFAMFAGSEIGEAVSGRSKWAEALLGVLSEAIYTPAAALAAFAILNIG